MLPETRVRLTFHSEYEISRRIKTEMRQMQVDKYWIYSSRGIIIPNVNYNKSEEEIRELIIRRMDAERETQNRIYRSRQKTEKVCWLREGF